MEPALAGNLTLANLLYDMGFNMWEKEQMSEGKYLLDVAERILEDLNHDKNDRLWADIYAIQAMFANSIGDEKAKQIIERRRKIMEIRQKNLEQQEKKDMKSYRVYEILERNAVNDFAYGLLQENKFLEAEPYFESCYETYCDWGTEKTIPFEYTKYYRNMGTVRMYQGRHDEAVGYSQKALALMPAAMDNNKATVRELRDKYLLACVLLQAGRLEDAYSLHLQMLQERRSIFGDDSEFTLESLYAVGAACYCLGRLEEAR
jgi:tetratricopeptide (TPR) repeat protein